MDRGSIVGPTDLSQGLPSKVEHQLDLADYEPTSLKWFKSSLGVIRMQLDLEPMSFSALSP